MGVEKEGTKSGGGYVGGFFQLFDWTSKSRKKLFATKSDLPEHLKHGKKVDYSMALSQSSYLVDEDENGVGASVRGSCDHSYASSVTDDEACGTRAPGVVARLMGLDSLPPSSFSDPYSTPYFDTRSLQDAQYFKNNQHDHQTPYSGKLVEKVEGSSRNFMVEKAEGSSRNFMEPKPQKALTRPIEKFQTEVLPPKSAKSIPVTHHKLLSPIKGPGFVPTNNAAYIMEAAARIIEPGSQASTKAKTPLVSSSTPLRVRDLKDKVEASQKGPLIGPSSMTSRTRDLKEKREFSQRTTRLLESSQRSAESNAAKYLKGQSLNRSWNGSADTSIKSPTHEEETSSMKNKGKSISLAIQAKVNVQRREGLSLTGGRSSMGHKEHSDVKSNQPMKANNVQKNLHKKSSGQNSSGALRQNNLKQNYSIDKDKVPSKPLVTNSHIRKVSTADSPYGRHRSSSNKSVAKSKVGSRKSSMEVTDSEKEVLYTSTNNFPRKKRSTDKDWNDRVVDNLFIEKTQKPVKSNLVSNKQHSWGEEVKKKDMDVVSFTFTTPLTRSNPGFETPGQAGQNNNGLSLDQRIKRVLLDPENTRSPVGYNVIGGDALGILLEQKLRELTCMETTCHDSSKMRHPATSAPMSVDQVTGLNMVNLDLKLQQKKDQDVLSSNYDSDISSAGPLELSLKHNSWIDEMEPQLLNCRHPSPISVLEPSFSIESCESSFSTDVTSTEGSKLCSSVQTQEVHSLNFSRKFYPCESDAELSDSASSTSAGNIVKKKHTSTFSVTRFGGSKTWELDYVKDILCNVELMYIDFSLGQASEVMNSHLFNQLEGRKGGFKCDDESMMRRKVTFDCVSECLDLRCRRYVGGGYRMWSKGFEMVKRKEWLAEDVYKEITGWSGMGDSMVDELVDKDMSSQYGRWLDYEIDAFELGSEVVDQIFNSLVDDVVTEILQM
ncbi:uncharacterized protein LOC109814979 [Cajanus cajan]|uniref:DUF4378 domain-containing protein n=1 Tax=Cajanus cajan TaxID=3821 RepID=A0A151RXU0_CAJCA|nr:uncharacterized protein LOC109814979 [Cajanus cajan]XP_020235118.1 uncharacterized protein LOC109814979 [Cajanus cajan]XP_020235119.1 uncharacterized protein LOC109814979 [Cajanus cajan]XP_020235121.1 uncharacterized protein LOC109814979 [Cajanus cajan]XP_020235122.1 uncharacterized protein LOC109814979 [Cajanus cajan]XP_020235123.1 uncharacterized protein LOC109814979 [Cajanus cajan]XP_029130516.1 uncharacterized protein LOC109814979 [Cajanus cajan]KYP47287.1 hypothetical protein KK1_031